jgi:hypothetical protein
MSFLLSGFLPGEGGAPSSEDDVITRLVPPTYMYIGNREKEGEGERERVSIKLSFQQTSVAN